jgi:transcriptional regulator with XRE-family HTH domain
MEAMVEEERCNANVARRIYKLRTKAGLSQRQLAERVGTTASVICRLEDADYDGHSLTMLRRIAQALNHRVQIHLVARDSHGRGNAAHSVSAVSERPAADVAKAAKKRSPTKARRCRLTLSGARDATKPVKE